MFDWLIRFSLRNRTLVVVGAALGLVYGGWLTSRLPVDVFPDLNRPTVTVMTEAGGLSPEEVETLVTRPIEVSLNGVPGVKRVRSSSGIGLSVVYVEFEWGTDIYLDRQLVAEKLSVAREQLPADVTPNMAPVSSIMGEILLLGLTTKEGALSPLELRSIVDWTIRQRLLTIHGVAQVTTMGGGVAQYQVLVDPGKLAAFNLTLDEVEKAAGLAQRNTTGGFVERKSQEFLVRNVSRTAKVEDLAAEVVAVRNGVPIRLDAVAEVRLGPKVKRGDGGVNGGPAVILAVQKQPGASTLDLTRDIEEAVHELEATLPAGVKIVRLFEQSRFIEAAIGNVVVALRDGAILVVIVLFLFLLNVRTTLISLTAIPLSFIVTALVFKWFGIGINTMTLGGLAVAIGELVDDAIVDVENVFRRLKENQHAAQPKPVLEVIYAASSEVRNSIVFATIIVVLVFLPLFALGGIEGRLFAPLGVAYIVSILASLVVSLTVTPALCSFLLANAKVLEEPQDGFFVRWLKRVDARVLHSTLDRPVLVLGGAAVLVLLAAAALPFMGREFLPPFNEGTATVNVLTAPGTSLTESNRIATLAEKLILDVPEVASTGRRTGRAEQDEHAEGVHYSEIDVDFKAGGRPREEVLADLRKNLSQLVGTNVSVGQPISHRLDHLLSGIRAQIAVKVFGPDLAVLRAKAEEIRRAMSTVPGVVDLQVEQQVLIPQLRVQVRRERAARYGIHSGELSEQLEGALNGKVVDQVFDRGRTYDVVVRLEEDSRADLESIRRILIETPTGAKIPLESVAEVFEASGPNLINRDNVARRVVVMANTQDRDLGSIVDDVRKKISSDVRLDVGYFITYEGQFESQQAATRLIALLSLFSLAGMFLVLYTHFRSTVIVAQVMLNIPLAMIGSVAAILVTGGTFSIGSLVGFVTLCGIASRNTIMMISHYIHLVEAEGQTFSRELVMRGSLERLVPVLMTALTAGLALVPLVLAKGEPGKEILYPVATAILGGLVSSTLLDIVVTPAVFLRFGGNALTKYIDERRRARDEKWGDRPAPPVTADVTAE